ncbi:dihydroorotate dehydrogenase 2 [Planctomycetes bacterium CA13]|uniref:Dihydroorotate dehydrogenase 2 n=1 Tax=Novipirellula herctigrandis TaxID=2527986 RepID=A0A5C5ZBL5_9BACT|nr:dihydroorotate dehydrogenase 2 [Planctomycetes bacterium CA13]
MAVRLLCSVQGLVLFGKSPQIDISLDNFELINKWILSSASSTSSSLESIMRVHSYCPVMPLAACGGISASGDVIKVLLAGADVAMISSAVYREGPDVIRTMIDGLVVFMERHHFQSIRDLQANRPLRFASEEERHDYVQTLSLRLNPHYEDSGTRAMHCDRWGHPQPPMTGEV